MVGIFYIFRVLSRVCVYVPCYHLHIVTAIGVVNDALVATNVVVLYTYFQRFTVDGECAL